MCNFISDMSLINFKLGFVAVDERCAAILYLIQLVLSKYWHTLKPKELGVSADSILSLADLQPWSKMLQDVTGLPVDSTMIALAAAHGTLINGYKRFMEYAGQKELNLAVSYYLSTFNAFTVVH